ncbi:MAG: hypothetical protein ACK5MA_09900 [Parachlamydiaceae bacterium]
MKRIQCRRFTLLEVLIALALTTILLTTLLAAYFQAETASLEGERYRASLWIKRVMTQRLNAIFSTLATPSTADKQFFFLGPEGNSLIFSYDNGINFIPIFSGDVLSELYLSKNGEITLLTWPDRASWNEELLPLPKREVLMSNIDNMSFSFFQTASDKEAAQWIDSWDKSKNALPGLIRLQYQKRKSTKPEQIIFLVPQAIGVLKE